MTGERVPDWLRQHAPEALRPALEWLLSPTVLTALAVGSVLLFILSVIGLPYFIARVPADYFSSRERRELGIREAPHSPWRKLAVVGKNLLGFVLLVLGIAMLVLPGQGLLAIVVSLFLLDFPGKRALQRRVIASPTIFRMLNAIRKRAGAPPLERGSWV